MFYYKIENQKVIGKFQSRPRNYDVESEEYYELGGTLIDGVYTAPAMSNEEIDNLRAQAYANPITGSDKILAEIKGAELTGESEEVIDTLKEQWLTRVNEIKAEYPKEGQ